MIEKTLFSFFFVVTLAYAQGSGSALRFSDEASYVTVNTTTGLESMHSGTIMGWVKPGNDAYGCMISSWHNGSGNRQFPIHLESDGSGNVRFGVTMVRTDNAVLYVGRTALAFPENEWYHVAYTSQAGSGTFTLYVNGMPQTMTAAFGSPTSFFFGNAMLAGDNIQLGAKSDNLGAHRGHITATLDEVAIWDTVLPQAEIQQRMCETLSGTEPGLVAYYRMDEGVDNSCSGGQDVCDASGNGNHGTKF